MRYLILSLFSFLAFSLNGQTNKVNEVQKLITSFSESQDVTLIPQAQKLVSEIFEDRAALKDPTRLCTKAQVTSLALEHTDIDNPYQVCDEIEKTYASALANDQKMKKRNTILNHIYNSKSAMRKLGNLAYEEENYESAFTYYQKLLKLNDLEVAHPRHASRDYSLKYTSGVYASLAGKKDEAARIYEELVEVEFPRVDMYDTLISYYTEKEKEADVKRITRLKEERFPE